MIYIDFFGGLHGHFLEYTINSLNPEIKNFNPFTRYGTSHNFYPKSIAKCEHFSTDNLVIPNPDNVIQITVTPSDCLLINLLSFSRAGDHRLDLYHLEKNFAKTIRPTPYYAGFQESLLNYGIDLDNDDKVQRSILRESLKFNFIIPEQNSLYCMAKKISNGPHSLDVWVREMYNLVTYLNLIDRIIMRFNLPYQVDVPWYSQLWKNFINQNSVITDEIYVNQVLTAIKNKTNIPIALNIIQEAWLDAQLENLYNIEMPPEQDQYFKTTDDINYYLKRL